MRTTRQKAHRLAVPLAIASAMLSAALHGQWEAGMDDDAGKATKSKYAIQPQGQSLTWLCGLYRLEEGLPAFVILTREPAEDIRFIHDRMPLMLPRDQVDAWISPREKPESIIAFAQTRMRFQSQ